MWEDFIERDGQTRTDMIKFLSSAGKLAGSYKFYSKDESPDVVLCLSCCRDSFRAENRAGTAEEALKALRNY